MFLANLVRLIRRWGRYNENVRELSGLADRELADIGIARSEIPAIAWETARN